MQHGTGVGLIPHLRYNRRRTKHIDAFSSGARFARRRPTFSQKGVAQMSEQRTTMVSLVAAFILVAGCANMSDVLKAKAAGEGTTEVYPVNKDQAWEIAMTVFRWEGAEAIEPHRDQGYMLTSTGMNFWSYGALMGAWVEPVDHDYTEVTVITKRRLATSIATTLTETTFQRRFAEAVEIVKAGKPLPPSPPGDSEK